MTEAQNIELTRRWLHEIWIDRNDQTVHELMHPDAVGHLEGLKTRGIEEFLAARNFILTAFPDFKVVAEQMLAQGDNVVFRWVATGTHGGELLGVAPTGKPVTFRGITWMRLADGKVVEGWDSWNQGALMEELKAAAAPAAAGPTA